jgi:serine/threonine protein kinase
MIGYDYKYSDEILDLLGRMMAPKPENRLLASEALAHPAFNIIKKVDDLLAENDAMREATVGAQCLPHPSPSSSRESIDNEFGIRKKSMEWPVGISVTNHLEKK